MKEPTVNYIRCNGCGSCAVICPGVFRMGDDGKAWVIGKECCSTCTYCIAVNICPVVAISLE